MTPLKRTNFVGRLALSAVIVAAAYPVTAYSAVGRMDFVVGRVVAVGADGRERVLAKGAELEQGDAVNTAVDGRAQIRFVDGAYVSLQPSTTFKVEEYRYAGKSDGSEKGFFSLLKGGLRTITGAIGKTNRNAYQVATPAATIGIRGTGYRAQLGNSLSVSVGEGAVALTNKGGELVLSAGQSGFVQDFNTAPQLTFEKPATPPAPLSSSGSTTAPKEDNYVAGDATTPSGGSVVIPVVTRTGNISLTAYSGGSYVEHYPVSVELNSANVATRITNSSSGVYIASGTTTVEGGTLDYIGWARWSNGSVDDSGSIIPYPGQYQGVHHVFGTPTSFADIEALAMQNATLTYQVAGYTTPTFSDGVGNNMGNGTLSGTVVAHFGSYLADLDLALSFQSGAHQYHMAESNVMVSGEGIYAGSIPASYSGVGSDCVEGCSTTFKGFFAGPGAANLGAIYNLSSDHGFSIQGAAAFNKQ